MKTGMLSSLLPFTFRAQTLNVSETLSVPVRVSGSRYAKTTAEST